MEKKDLAKLKGFYNPVELISHVKIQTIEWVKTFACYMCAGYVCLESTKNF